MLRTPRYLTALVSFAGLMFVSPGSAVTLGARAADASAALQAPAPVGPTPILIIASPGNPFARYYAEILRAEGLNAFAVVDIGAVTGTLLDGYDVAILGEMPLDAAQQGMLSGWVDRGGNLIAMRPDKQLYPLFGLAATTSTLSNGYLLFDRTTRPAAGLVGETLQFHGDADLATLNGAATLATLYSTATTSAGAPAVTVTNVGVNGGHAAAFLFDLARSVVYTRQGNPAWSGQNRDAVLPIRSDDLYFGGDEADWLDPSKVAIPQADEQQRLLANLILDVNADKKPLPRFWYFPRGGSAVVVMTGDDHGNGGTIDRFEQYKAFSPANCSAANWECVRSTSYVYPNTLISPAEVADYTRQGFEIALHVNTNCADWTPSTLDGFYSAQLAEFAAAYPQAPSPVTNRTHCVVWSDYATQPAVERSKGIRFDTSYYYYPNTWVQGRPGLFTGSGMPMRFARADGTTIDVYQAATQMTDESQQGYPSTVNALLDKALGPEGFYGVFTANMHTDFNNNQDGNDSKHGSDLIVDAARTRGVPVVSAAQMLAWLDGRNDSSFAIQSWNGTTLSFSIARASGANGLQAMLPLRLGLRKLVSLSGGGVPLPLTSETIRTIKGIEYVFFPADSTLYQADYILDNTAPVVSDLTATVTGPTSAVITWTTDEPATSALDLGIAATPLQPGPRDSTLTTSHSITLTGLTAGQTYDYRVASADAALPPNSRTEPDPSAPPATFRTRGPEFVDTTTADFGQGAAGSATYVAETIDGEVILRPTVGTEFSTPDLPADWFVQQWAPAGAATVTQGLVAVDGAAIGQNELYEAGRSLEFVATFSDELQHIGFGIDFSNAPWAIFSTDLNQVYARTNNGLASENTALGSRLFGSPHRYRIEWTASGAVYFVDGVQVASHAVSMTAPMRPLAASDYNLSGAQLRNDWFRMSPYAATGIFVSRVFDAGVPANQWGALSWTAATPAGTSVAFSVRSGPTSIPDSLWTPWRAVPSSGSQAVDQSRYLQYRVTLSTTDPRATPEVQRVAIEYQAEPPATADNGPTITPGAAIAGASSAVITWTTNVPATSRVESVGARPFATVSDAELTTTHRVSVEGLTPGTTYQYKISSADFSGVSSSWPVVGEQTFTTLAPSFIDTTAADFSQGISTNTSVTSLGDGAVSLAGGAGAVTWGAGPGLPAGWLDNPWPTGGHAIAADGALKVSGAWASTSATFAPGQSMEAVATFSPNPFQHVGFAENLAGDGSWALFSTRGTTATLFASTGVGSAVVDVPLAVNFVGLPHKYRIDWTAGNIVFSIDDVVVSSQVTDISAPMHAIAGQFNVSPPPAEPLTVAALSLPSYAPTGTFLSRVFDAGQPQNWDKVVSSTVVPPGTTLTLAVYTAASADGPWNPTPLPAFSQFIRYQANFATTVPSSTPTMLDVRAVIAGSHENHAPTANPRTVADNENTPIAFAVTGSDPDGDTLTFSVATQPLHGALTGTGPTLTYTPDHGYTGTDTFTFTVSDGTLVSSAAPVTIFVSHVNHVPLAADDHYTVNEDTTLAVAGLGVLANDGDVDPGDVLRAVVLRNPAHGTLILNADGSFSYTPAPGFSGPDSFTYTVNDGGAVSNVATVTITVNAVNQAPSAFDDGPYSTAEDTPLSVTAANGLLKNDIDVEPGLLTAVLVAGPAASQGTLVLNGDGAFTFTPAPEFNGPVTFTYQAKDAEGALSNAATVTLAVGAVNDAPAAADTSASTDEDATATVTLTATDIDSGSLTFTTPATTAHGTLGPVNAPVCSTAATGVTTCTATVTYTPTHNYYGPDSFTYTTSDGSLTSNTASAGLTVRAVNDAPVANAGSLNVTEDTPQTGTLTATDVDGNALTYSVVAQGGKGTVAITNASTGAYTYTPNANATGADSFTFKVNDGTVNSNTATIDVTINAVNDAPVANTGSLNATEDTPQTGTLAATDIDGNALTYSVVAQGGKGTVAITNASTGAYTYTPNANATGADSFTFKVNDGTVNSNTATINVTINAVNDAPSFTKGADQAVAASAGARTVPGWATGLSAGPADESGQALDFLVTNSNNALFAVQPAIQPNGTLTYTPSPSGNGSAIVTVRLHDNGGGAADTSAPQVFTITVTLAVSTTTAITSNNPSSSAYGQSVTLTATVTNTSGSGGTPTGSVQFYDNGSPLGAAVAVNGAGTAQLVTTAIGGGTRSLTATYVPAGSFLTSTSPAVTQTVSQATGTATLGASVLTPTYSDMETFTASYTPGSTNGPAPAMSNVIFKMGTQTLGPATAVTLVGGVYQYTRTVQMVEPSPFGATPTGQMKPGTRTATVTFTDPNFTIANAIKSLTIRAEDARVAYTDPTSFSLGGSATGTVVLHLTAKDITAMVGDPASDPTAGDIRNATVQFWDRTNNVLLGTATVTASGDTATVGTATLNWAVNLGTATSKTYSIGFVVANYYTRNQAADNVTITVTKN